MSGPVCFRPISSSAYLAFALAAIAAGLAAPRFGLVATALFYGSVLALSALVTLAVETAAARR